MPATQTPLLDSYWKDIRHCEPVSREREIELIRRARDGDSGAMQDLIAANVRFVVSVANNFRGTDCPLSELISDGNVGLAEAARRFDETRGFKFVTYAVWWIRQSIRRSLSERRGIVVAPSNRVADLQKVENARHGLSQTLGRTPTLSELAHETGLSMRRVERGLEVAFPDIHLDRPFYADDEETPVATIFESADPPSDSETQEREEPSSQTASTHSMTASARSSGATTGSTSVNR